MEFTIGRTDLYRAVQRTLGIADRKTVIPILNNILIKTEEEGIKVVATDRELSLISHYPATIVQKGEITVPAKNYMTLLENFLMVLFSLWWEKMARFAYSWEGSCIVSLGYRPRNSPPS